MFETIKSMCWLILILIKRRKKQLIFLRATRGCYNNLLHFDWLLFLDESLVFVLCSFDASGQVCASSVNNDGNA